jgi:haloalkane dehalogenase
MNVFRTPKERFVDLPGHPFVAHTFSVESGLEMTFVDEGDRNGKPILMLHGEPTWSFLYRKMIPIFVSAGFRAIAPDLIGFGRSDKPTDQREYSYAKHVEWVTRLVTQLDLREATLVGQDWGSLIGLRVAAENEQRFSRIVIANGALPIGKDPGRAFRIWQAFARYTPVFPVGRIVAAGCVTPLTPAVRAAYDAPFPNETSKAAARAFPKLVPTTESDPAVPANRAAWAVLKRWEKPFLTLFGENDPIFRSTDRYFKEYVPGAKGQPHERIRGGHFVQEDRGDYLAQAIVAWMTKPSGPT